MRAALLLLIACGQPTAPAVKPVAVVADAASADAPDVTDDEKLAAIQKAMTELRPAAQQCWAAAAVIRFDIEGELAALIDIGPPNHASFVRDTTHNKQLAACVQQVLEAYPYAPPLHGKAIQLPFKFSAPDGQSVIDRRLVPFAGQGDISVAVLLDENNANNPAASMFEVAIAPGGTTGMRVATRAEMWFAVTGEASVTAPGLKLQPLTGVMVVPAGSPREIKSANGAHLVLVVTPGGPEGAARAGALPTPEWGGAIRSLPAPPQINTHPVLANGHEIYFETQPMAAAISTIRAGASVPEHVHAKETELIYFLAGGGSMQVAGATLPVTATSVVQIPPNTKHSVTATSDMKIFQVYTPAGPEQRWK